MAFESGGRSYALTIFQAPAGWIDAADWLLRFTIVGVVVLYWFRCRKSSDLVLNGGGMALLFAAIPLLFPTTQKNYFVFLLPTSVYLMYVWFGMKFGDPWFRGLILASFALSSLTTQGICGEFLSNRVCSRRLRSVGHDSPDDCSVPGSDDERLLRANRLERR